MRSPILIAALVVVGAIAAGTVVSGDGGGAPMRQWAIAEFSQPTLVGSTIVQGPVLFEHDSAKMARHEPCTMVYLFDPKVGPLEEVASFHCIPTPRQVVHKFTIRTRPNTNLGFGCVLTEYQFAGDLEGHGVPTPVDGH